MIKKGGFYKIEIKVIKLKKKNIKTNNYYLILIIGLKIFKSYFKPLTEKQIFSFPSSSYL